MMDNSITYLISEIEESGEKIETKLRNEGIDVTFGKHSENKTDLSEIIDILLRTNFISDEDKELLVTNLTAMGVECSVEDSLETLINKILDIAPSVGGITPTVSIDISKTPSSGNIYDGDTVVIETKVNANYDDESLVDIDLKGYLQGATVVFRNGNTVLGTAITDINGIATYTINNITEGNYSITAYFDGSNTDYESATSSALIFTVDENPILFFDECNSADGLSNYGSVYSLEGYTGASLSYDSNMNAYKINSSSRGSKLIPITTLTSMTKLKISAEFYLPSSISNECCIGLHVAGTNHTAIGFILSNYPVELNYHTFKNNGWTRNTSIGNYTRDTWVTIILEIDEKLITYTIKSGDTTLSTGTYDLSNVDMNGYFDTDSDRQYGIDIGWNNNRYGYVRNIKVESIPNITISSDKTILSYIDSDTCNLTAQFTKSGTPVSNKTITFKQGNTVLGTAITNNNGIATLNNAYTSSNAGDVTFTAIYNDIISNTLTIEDIYYYNPLTTDKGSYETGNGYTVTYNSETGITMTGTVSNDVYSVNQDFTLPTMYEAELTITGFNDGWNTDLCFEDMTLNNAQNGTIRRPITSSSDYTKGFGVYGIGTVVKFQYDGAGTMKIYYDNVLKTTVTGITTTRVHKLKSYNGRNVSFKNLKIKELSN